jgi:pimeloyl-ACP methyl ester carboxylesterase
MKKVIRFMLYLCALLVFILIIAGVSSRDAIVIPGDFEGAYVTINDVKIRFRQIGTGPDLLFIHGVPGSIEDWESLVPMLSSRYRLTLYDRPGHGFSSAENITYNLEHNAQIAFGLIDKLKLRDVIVVGHSYGGSIVMAMAVQKILRVKGFIAVGGASYEVRHIDPLFRIIRLPLIGRGFATIASAIVGAGMVAEGIEQAFHPNLKAIPAGYSEKRETIWLQTKVICTIAREELNLNHDLQRIIPRYRDIQKSFIIIHGSDDLLVPSDDSRRLHSDLLHSRLIMLENTGHQVQYAQPGAIVKAIDLMSRS